MKKNITTFFLVILPMVTAACTNKRSAPGEIRSIKAVSTTGYVESSLERYEAVFFDEDGTAQFCSSGTAAPKKGCFVATMAKGNYQRLAAALAAGGFFDVTHKESELTDQENKRVVVNDTGPSRFYFGDESPGSYILASYDDSEKWARLNAAIMAESASLDWQETSGPLQKLSFCTCN